MPIICRIVYTTLCKLVYMSQHEKTGLSHIVSYIRLPIFSNNINSSCFISKEIRSLAIKLQSLKVVKFMYVHISPTVLCSVKYIQLA